MDHKTCFVKRQVLQWAEFMLDKGMLTICTKAQIKKDKST